MRFRSLSLAMALSAAPLAVQAQPFQGLYIGAGAGYNLPNGVHAQPNVLGAPRTNCTRAAASRHSAASATVWATVSASNWRATTARRTLNDISGPDPPGRQRQVAHLWRDGQRAVRHGYRRSLAVSLSGRRRRLCLDRCGGGDHHAGGGSLRSSTRHPGQFRLPGDRRPVVPRFRASRGFRLPPNIVSSASRGRRRSPRRSFPTRWRLGVAEAPVQQQLPARRALCLQRGGTRAGRQRQPWPPRPLPRAPTWCSSTGTRRR